MTRRWIPALAAGLLLMASVAPAQEPGSVGVVFSDGCDSVLLGNCGLPAVGTFGAFAQPDPNLPTMHIHVYIVAFGIENINGYEFSLITNTPAPFSFAKTVYGPAPVDSGEGDYDVRVETAGCVSDPAEMGLPTISWTLCDYDFNYFGDPGNDIYYGVQKSMGSPSAIGPLYSSCDSVRHEMPPANHDEAGILPDGCAILNPTLGQRPTGNEDFSWGLLKAAF